MPTLRDAPEKLRPFLFHGVDLAYSNKRQDSQATGDCPFCGKEGHFFVSQKTGQWDCKVCGESGNVFSFLRKLHRLRLKETTNQEYRSLSKNRGLPIEIFGHHKLAFDALQDRWLIPMHNASGKLANLIVWSESCSKPLNTPTLVTHLEGANDLNPEGPIFTAEGIWDFLALKILLERSKAPGSVVAVPGSGTFKDEWVQHFKGRDAVLLYDNDAPGAEGMQRVVEKLRDTATSIRTIDWPKGTPDRFDIRDHYIKYKRAPKRALKKLLGWTKEAEASPTAEDNGKLCFVRYSQIEPEEVEWLVAGKIPLGKLTLFQGPPGNGKTYVALYVASQVSQGRKFADGSTCLQGETAFFTLEDGAGDTLRPRLDLLKADPSKVFHFDCMQKDGQEFGLDLVRDLSKLEKWLINHPKVKLLVFDPLPPFLGGRVDSHKNADVRRVLGPLCRLGEKYRVAIVGVNHVTKAPVKAVHRGQGSVAFTAQSRACWQISEDREDPDRKLFLPVKMNLCKATGLAFRITDRGLTWERGAVSITADEAETDEDGGTPRDEAKQWLRSLLAKGPVPASEIWNKAGEDRIAPKTLKRAKAELKVRSVQERNGWSWFLPRKIKATPEDVERLKSETRVANNGTKTRTKRQKATQKR